ncbi:MAG: ROK family protein [Verrucomicrobiaceae bacterium]|nr:ROK family protein [Verrucomicrobiaceae bacterium]
MSTAVHLSRMRTLKVSQENLHARIIELVRSGRASSRGVLARELSVAPSTMGLYVDQLIAAGWLRESGLIRGKTGRPKMNLELEKNGTGWFAGVEFTASRIQVIAVDFAGNRLSALTKAMPSPADAEAVIRQVQQAIQDMVGRMTEKLLGIGVGAPGLVNPDTGMAIYSMAFPDWADIPLQARLSQAFAARCTIQNNLRVIALAERWFGEGRDEDDFVVLGPRSGFAMSIVKGGELIRGAHLGAGEAGFWPLATADGEEAAHDLLSAPAVWRRLTGSTRETSLPTNLHDELAKLACEQSPAWEEVTGLLPGSSG